MRSPRALHLTEVLAAGAVAGWGALLWPPSAPGAALLSGERPPAVAVADAVQAHAVASALACLALPAVVQGKKWLALLRAAFVVPIAALVAHVLIVLFGAPITDDFAATFALACEIAVAGTLVPAMTTTDWDVAVRVLAGGRPETALEHLNRGLFAGAALGAWLGALPIPLDWDRPWQRWPITCAVGCFAGAHLGGVLGLVLARRAKKKRL